MRTSENNDRHQTTDSGSLETTSEDKYRHTQHNTALGIIHSNCRKPKKIKNLERNQVGKTLTYEKKG